MGALFTETSIAGAIMASTSNAIVASDRDGIIQYWNPGAERIFGHLAADAIGQSLDIIIPARLRGRHWEGYRRVMEGGASRYSDGDLLAVPALRKDGSSISVEFTIAPVCSAEGAVVGLVALMRDVTARFEETKALRQKLRSLANI
jgi:PAS domain S-box-containing protein